MKAYELARSLLSCEDLPVSASIDISTGDSDSGRRVFTEECFGVNNKSGVAGEIVICFYAPPFDNDGERL